MMTHGGGVRVQDAPPDHGGRIGVAGEVVDRPGCEHDPPLGVHDDRDQPVVLEHHLGEVPSGLLETPVGHATLRSREPSPWTTPH